MRKEARNIGRLRKRAGGERVVRAAFIVIVGLFVGAVQAQSFDVAAGAVVVTPVAGSYLAGYGPDRRSTGSLDPVWVKVFLLMPIDCLPDHRR